jgi:hypothetical protein
MFATDRSAFAVLVPLALLVAVVAWSNRPHAAPQHVTASPNITEEQSAPDRAQTVAANFPSR